jgi:hypothetical protein
MGMRKYIGMAIAAICMSAAVAGSIPNTSPTPKTFLGPTGRLGVTKAITDNTAFSIAGEIGPKNYRLGGTLGWEFDYNQRIKASAEYLAQKITYSFFTGEQNVWMDQTAAGLDYQYDFRDTGYVNTLLDVSGYYSYAPSHSLGVSRGTYINSDGFPISYVVDERIAGSNAFGVAPGITLVTLDGTRAGFDLNYDNVLYNTKNSGGLNATGIGGTVRLNQALTDDLSIGGSAAVRRPFNNYQLDLTLDNLDYYGVWVLRAFGAYTIGKTTLPSTYNVGLGADYLMDASTNDGPYPMMQPIPDFKGEQRGKVYKDQVYKDMPPVMWEESNYVDKDFLSWVAVPAVYMPQVLAVVDEKQVCAAGSAPTFSGPIGPDVSVDDNPFNFQTAPFFSGSNLTYTMVAIDNNDPSDSSISINSTTGEITVITGFIGSNYTVTVTATNACGSATSDTFNMAD